MSALDMLDSDIRATASVVSASRNLIPPPNDVTAVVGDAIRAKFEDLAAAIELEAAKQGLRNIELQELAKAAAESARALGDATAAQFLKEANATDDLIEKLKDIKMERTT